MIAIVGVAIALTCFVLYALDRKSKGEPIAWDTAGKITLFGGLLGSGITFVTSGDAIVIPEVIKEGVVDVAQDMFVGKPTF